MTLHRSGFFVALTAGLMLCLAPNSLRAQATEGEAEAQPKAAAAKAAPADRSPQTGSEKGGKPNGEKPAADKDGKEKKPDDAPKVVARPDKPQEPADPKELEIQPDAEGKLRLNFTGQPWEDVLVWLAGISGLSLDWQELPADYLNLRTQESYTVPEIRDLINRHLLARGFTLLRNGEVLSVVNLKKLDPSLVPSVAPDELQDRDPHEFVRVTFPLDWLLAEKAVEEFKPLLSPNGQLAKLGATNRIRAIDAVVNLRAIHRLLQEEQSGRGQERMLREFRLQHTRAEDVKALLEELLGIKKEEAGPVSAQQMMMMQRMMQQQQQQQRVPNAGDKKKDDIALIVNPRENSIIAQAPPDRMAVIEETVKMLDVPREADQALLRNINRMQVYRLAQLDPEALVEMLTDLGDLDPQTRLEVDKKGRAVIAYASLADHLTIRMVIEKLDGTDRKFEVVRLRRLQADFVAGTIRFMMGGEEEETDSRRSRYSRYYYSPFGYGGDEEEEQPSGKFRVDADVENNRLLLWANDVELDEVENLLVKLGEIPPEDGSGSTLRVLDLTDEQSEELLKRLQQTWPRVGPNPLIVTPPGGPAPRPQPGEAPPSNPPAGVSTDAALSSPAAPSSRAARTAGDAAPFVLAQLQRSTEAKAEPERPAPPETGPPGERQSPPIHITRGPNGELVLRSPDTRALTALETLAFELTPPRRDWHVFHLKHPATWAWGVATTLEDFFAQEDENGSGMNGDWFFGYYPSDDSGSTPNRLSKRRPLKFLPDSDSHTILVQGADEEQLKIIQELIDLYDQPESHDSASVRLTKTYFLKYSKAPSLAKAIKDVYRDLLSANDAAFQQNRPQNQKEQPPQAERSYTYIFGGGGEEDPPEPPIKFKGLLSIGVDEQSNALIISAPASLLTEVGNLIDSLDQAAESASVSSVVPINPSVDSAAFRRQLERILGPNVRIGGTAPPPQDATTQLAPPGRRFTVSRTGDGD